MYGGAPWGAQKASVPEKRSVAEDGAAPAAPCANRWSTALARAAPAGRLPEAPRARPDRCRQRQWRRVGRLRGKGAEAFRVNRPARLAPTSRKALARFILLGPGRCPVHAVRARREWGREGTGPLPYILSPATGGPPARYPRPSAAFATCTFAPRSLRRRPCRFKVHSVGAAAAAVQPRLQYWCPAALPKTKADLR